VFVPFSRTDKTAAGQSASHKAKEPSRTSFTGRTLALATTNASPQGPSRPPNRGGGHVMALFSLPRPKYTFNTREGQPGVSTRGPKAELANESSARATRSRWDQTNLPLEKKLRARRSNLQGSNPVRARQPAHPRRTPDQPRARRRPHSTRPHTPAARRRLRPRPGK